MACGSRVGVWTVEGGNPLLILNNSGQNTTAVAFSPDGKCILLGKGDGTIDLWDIAAGDKRATLVALDDGLSLTFTPEGYFASSSAAAERYLKVRVGNRVLGIGSFREDFYRPDLVKASILGSISINLAA